MTDRSTELWPVAVRTAAQAAAQAAEDLHSLMVAIRDEVTRAEDEGADAVIRDAIDALTEDPTDS